MCHIPCRDETTLSVKATTVELLDRDGGEIDAREATDVDGPEMWRGTRAAEGKYAAYRAEVVLRGSGMPLVQHEFLERRQQTEARRVDAVIQSPSLAAHAAVAGADVIEIGVHFEAHLPAVT
jgi:hypothetical protein